MTNSYTLHLLPERYGVVRLDPETELNTKGGHNTELLAVIHTPEETTVVCLEQIISKDKLAEKGWRVFKISGSLDFSLVGVLACLLSPLAVAGISVYTLSTYSTDFILIKGRQLRKAIQTLRNAGHEIIE